MKLIVAIAAIFLLGLLSILILAEIFIPAKRRARTPAQYAADISYLQWRMKVRHIHAREQRRRDLKPLRDALADMRIATVRLQRTLEVQS